MQIGNNINAQKMTPPKNKMNIFIKIKDNKTDLKILGRKGLKIYVRM